MPPKHSHRFVEDYDGMVAFGFSRDVDEKTLMVYLQKFSDDDLLKMLLPRLSHSEMESLFDLLSELMRKHLSDNEYHAYFLKEEKEHP
ncbi:hypothetical protein SAMN02746041_02323 [Desulfacinum hydrothermale DSM 13146]|uniref:Cytoplasmic protein n=1 Tax=Desulfacinum hydrothermale DSM 13146 TaxID=1121390 RepID=A0A1W1XNF8_9BACT|nr:cytoplasmic protein [Desulfacinum hydrothermale]SMC25407.1 hypothetical protein SAMN02746041_02323 [Desulfacinum hydrothermale DSM 13146]